MPREGFTLDTIRSLGLKGKSVSALVKGLLTLPLSAWDAWRVVATRRPHVVVGVGGYSSGPIVLMAWLRGVPTLLHEQNAQPGLTNRLLARVARAVAVTFESSLAQFGAKAFVSGNPVRPRFLQAAGEPAGARKVLIFGGSQGAHAINLAMVEAASELARASAPPAITHQTGAADLELVRQGYTARRACRSSGALHRGHGRGDERGLVDRLARRVDDAGGDCGGGACGAARAAADRDRRSPAAERRGAGAGRRGGDARAAGDDRRRRSPRACSRCSTTTSVARAMAMAVKRFARPDAASVIVDRVLALAREAQ